MRCGMRSRNEMFWQTWWERQDVPPDLNAGPKLTEDVGLRVSSDGCYWQRALRSPLWSWVVTLPPLSGIVEFPLFVANDHEASPPLTHPLASSSIVLAVTVCLENRSLKPIPNSWLLGPDFSQLWGSAVQILVSGWFKKFLSNFWYARRFFPISLIGVLSSSAGSVNAVHYNRSEFFDHRDGFRMLSWSW